MNFSPRLISDLLGRPVTESERGSIPTLNDVPASMLAEMRAAMIEQGWGRMSWCLQFFVETVDSAVAARFAADVVRDREDPATWEIGEVLYVPSIRRADRSVIVESDAASIRGELDRCPGERWYTDTLGHLWEASGLPGVLVRGHRYWQRPPGNLVQCGLGRLEKFVFVPDFDIGVRRWMARRMAWFTSKRTSFDNLTADIALDVMREGRAIEPSRDARIAADALVREARLGSPDFPQRAGYLGPDDWYR